MRTAAVQRRSTAISIAAAATACGLAAACNVAAASLIVVATGLSGDARRALGFGFDGVDHTTTEAARIALHNTTYAAGTLLCALVVPWLSARARQLTSCLLATLLVLNAAAIGIAFGAYRWRAITATAPHLPLEYAGLSLAGGAYLHACRHSLTRRALIMTAGLCTLLLAVAALVETYVSTGATR